jgi:hypothetical protein
MAPRRQFCLMVTRGRRTNYYWGERLKDLILHRLKPGDKFSYTKYVRGPILKAEMIGPSSYGII